MNPDVSPYDALLLLSFGGPEKPDDVVPFLENVTRGRGIPRERLEEVGEHYFLFGGRSPINDQNRALLAAIREDLAGSGIDLPVYWGNRNWDPYLADTLREMRDDGITRAAVITTSAYSSYSSCRQYRENLADAVAEVEGAPAPGPAAAVLQPPGLRGAGRRRDPGRDGRPPGRGREGAELVFVTHSIPTAMAETSGPPLRAATPTCASTSAVAEEVTARVRQETGRRHKHELVYCSRSGSPRIPWLEPDVNDHLAAIAKRGPTAVVMVPVGLRLRPHGGHLRPRHRGDGHRREARARGGPRRDPGHRPAVRGDGARPARRAGRGRARRGGRPASTVGDQPAWREVCAVGCCPNPRGERPALCGADA